MQARGIPGIRPVHQKKGPAGWRGLLTNLLAQCLSWLHVGGRRTLRALLELERHLLTLGQRLEAAAHDGGVMHEDILAAVARGDEAKTLAVVKPLHGSCNHENTSVC